MSAVAILVLLVIAYVAINAATTLLSQPLRVRVQDIALDILDLPNLSASERKMTTWMMESSMSSAIGMLVPVAATFALVTSILGGRSTATEDMARIDAHPRMDEMRAFYVLSIMACSPFAALLSVPILLLNALVAFLRSDANLIRAAEAPVLKASAQFQPC